MFSFIKRHWIIYLIGIVVALALGLGLAYFVGVKGSTPDYLHAEEVSAEAEDSGLADASNVA